MIKTIKYKDLLYTKAQFLKNEQKTLQQLLDSAYAKLKNASSREQKRGEENEDVRLWNTKMKRGLLTCGMFHSWENGRSQLIVQVKGNVTSYQVRATEAPKEKGATNQFNEGLLFFGVYDNHVIVLQSSALRRIAFEEYLNWLLQDACNEMGKENRLELLDRIPKKRRKDGKESPLQSIIIVPPFTTSPVQPSEGGQVTAVRELKVQVEPKDWGWLRDAIRGMGAKIPNELNLDADFNAERVHVEIQLSWRGRNKDRDETPVLDTILRAFRDVDHPPIVAKTADGKEIKGDELRLKKPRVPIEHDGRIPLAGSVFEQMQKYMTELLDSGDITAV